MRGAATQAMPVCIVEERQQSRCPPAAAPLRAAARRPAGGVARSLHTAPGMLVARALPAGLGASSKMYTLFPDGPLVQINADLCLSVFVCRCILSCVIDADENPFHLAKPPAVLTISSVRRIPKKKGVTWVTPFTRRSSKNRLVDQALRPLT